MEMQHSDIALVTGCMLHVFRIYKHAGLSRAALINDTNAIPPAIGNPFVTLTRRSIIS